MRRRCIAAALVFALVTPAYAEDLVRAQELFEKGRALVGAGNYKDACPLFEEALGHGGRIGTELNLAACWANIGRLVDAKKLFEVILQKTKTSADDAKSRVIAEKKIAELDERIPRLQIERGALSSSVTIYLDGVELVDTSEPIPVDPGTHEIEAEGAAKQTVTAVEKQVTEVILVAGDDMVGIGPEVPKRPSWLDGDRRPLYLGGAGAALILTGTITGIVTLSKRTDGIALCEGPETALMCGPEGRAKLDSARTLSHVTTGLFVIGTGLIVTGLIWKLQERGKKTEKVDERRARRPEQQRPRVTGWISGAGGGFALERTW
ncbi:MAG: tetratricopeptide repeat protein [Kofleriaceae bacterium]